jgi:hypothetical protein
MRLACLLAMLAACSGSGSGAEDGGASGPLAVSHPINETGHELDASTLSRVAKAIADHLRAEGFSARADPRMHAALIVQPRLTQCPGPPHPASLTTTDNDGGCLGSVTVIRRFTTRTAFTAVARTPPGGDLAQLSTAMAQAVTRGLRPQAGHAAAPEHDITATGMTVRQVGDGRFVIGDETIDLHAISHLHDPAVDTDVPEATNVTLNDTVPPMDHATITLYQVDPPLTGQPSREAGIDRGTDFRDPADLVQAAYSNYVSPVLTEDPAPIRIASHPIGHFIVKVEIPGYPTVLTGMTTIARADTELVNLTIGRQLGIGGVLLTPEPGRLNTSTEVARELALRQRRLRVVDGLYFHTSHGTSDRNMSLMMAAWCLRA